MPGIKAPTMSTEPSYLVMTFHCTRCGQESQSKHRQSNAQKPRALTYKLNICLACAGQWQNKPFKERPVVFGKKMAKKA